MDGQSIGFRSPGKGFRDALTGGPPEQALLATMIRPSWGELGDRTTRSFSAIGGTDSGLYMASAGGGGAPERLTMPVSEQGPTVYAAPSLLPSGKAVLFYILRLQGQSETVTVLDLETRAMKTLVEGGANPQDMPSGHLVFARGTTLMAVPFDPDSVSRCKALLWRSCPGARGTRPRLRPRTTACRRRHVYLRAGP